MERIVITVTRQHNGLCLSTIYQGMRFSKLYMGYRPWEAKKDFQQYVRNLEKRF